MLAAIEGKPSDAMKPNYVINKKAGGTTGAPGTFDKVCTLESRV